jgi:hypothetical protein
MDVYFDNNVLNDLQGLRGVSGDEVDRLRAAAKDRAIAPKLSFENIDEALAALVNHQPLALELLRLLADFFGLDRMIKPPDQLLTDDFVDLAFGDPRRPPEVQMPAALRDHLEGVLRADEGEIAMFLEAAAETRDQINEVWDGLRRAREQARAEIEPRHTKQPFGQFWRDVAPWLVEVYADKVGVARTCQELGVEKVLAVPSIGMMVGSNASMIYALVVEGRRADRGDSPDLRHALMASAADVFVTSDGGLRHILQRVPLITPAVIDLNQLLVSLGIRAGREPRGGRSRARQPEWPA